MNITETLPDQTCKPKIEIYFKQLSEKILRHYQKYGESDKCIDSIQREILTFLPSKIDNEKLIESFINPKQHRANQSIQHLIYRIIRTEDLKVSLHLTSAGIKIPIHSHPGDINALFVISGAIKLRQYTFNKPEPEIKQAYLTSNSCKVGLQQYFNTHDLETTKPLTVFFSIRCKSPKQPKNLLRRVFHPGFMSLAHI